MRDLADELQVGRLYDWPYVGAQRLHALYRPEWVRSGAGEPTSTVALGWHWGTLLDGRTTGTTAPPLRGGHCPASQVEAVLARSSVPVPPGRQAAHELRAYPACFLRPALPSVADQARCALREPVGGVEGRADHAGTPKAVRAAGPTLPGGFVAIADGTVAQAARISRRCALQRMLTIIRVWGRIWGETSIDQRSGQHVRQLAWSFAVKYKGIPGHQHQRAVVAPSVR